MPTRELLTPAQRLRLDALPVDLDDRLMARHHTLSEADVEIVSRRRTETNRLGFGVQLCLLRYPGRPLRPKEGAPEKMVRYVAAQLGADPRAMDSYAGGVGVGVGSSADSQADGRIGGKAGRDTTRREHLSEIVETFGFRYFGEETRGELSGWLAGVAAQTDSGLALVEALLEEMRRRGVVAPAISAAEALAWEARRRAREEAARALTANLSAADLERLDGLLLTTRDTTHGTTRSELVWLRHPPGAPPAPPRRTTGFGFDPLSRTDQS